MSAVTVAPVLTGARKAAVFLIGLGGEISTEVLRLLTPDEVRRISAEIATTPAVGSEQMLAVFREFESLADEGRLFAQGGAECARRLVESAFGPESAQKLLPGVQQPAAAESAVLEETDPDQAAVFLKNEHPQTVAVVLSRLSPGVAGRLLASLPEEVQESVALRLAALDRISAEAVRQVTDAIGSKLKSVQRASKADGVRTLAAVLNHLPPDRANALLGRLQEENETLTASVRSLMFVFEDILTIDKQGMKALIGKIDRKALTLALKGAGARLRSHFTQCMSQNAAEMLSEDMDALGPVRIRDVKAAQAEVIAAVRQLQGAGVISLGAAGGDEYVE